MRKWISIALALLVGLVIGTVGFFIVTPDAVERGQNKVVAVPLGITPAARALHATLDVADMHSDSLLWKRDLLARSDRGQICRV